MPILAIIPIGAFIGCLTILIGLFVLTHIASKEYDGDFKSKRRNKRKSDNCDECPFKQMN